MLMDFAALLRGKRLLKAFKLKDVKLGRQHERYQKQIKNIQTIFQKKHTQLESQSKTYQSQMEQAMRAQMMGGYGSYSTSSLGSMLGGVAGSIFNQIAMNGFQQYVDGGNDTKGLDATKFQEGLNGNTSNWSSEMLAIMNNIKGQATQFMQMQSQMMEQNISNMKMMVEQQKEMQDAVLDEQEEAMLLPLNEKDTDIECEQTYVRSRIEELKEEVQNLQESCKEEAKNTAPKFGL